MVALTLLAVGWPPVVAVAQDVGASGDLRSSVTLEIPGFRGLEPNLQLTYDSHARDGPLGVGWSLSGFSSITRASSGGGAPHYDSSDVFYLDGEELVPCAQGIEGGPAARSPSCRYPASADQVGYVTWVDDYRRIAFDPTPAGGVWRVWSKIGVLTTYEPEGRLGSTIAGVGRWRVTSVKDTTGHDVAFQYIQVNDALGASEEYPSAITYGETRVSFYWENRPDTGLTAIGGGLRIRRLRLRTIDVTVMGRRARTYALEYRLHAGTHRSVLSAVRQYGRDAALGKGGKVVSGSSLPPIRLSYDGSDRELAWQPGRSPSRPGATKWNGIAPASVHGVGPWTTETSDPLEFRTGDFDGDGRGDALFRTNLRPSFFDLERGRTLKMVVHLASGRFAESLVKLPDRPAVRDARTFPADVNGDGFTDLVILAAWPLDFSDHLAVRLDLATAMADGYGRFRLGPGFAQTSWISGADRGPFGPQCQPGDVNGDGNADFVCVHQDRDGEQFLGTALSRGDGTFDTSPSRVSVAPSPTPGQLPQFSQHTLPTAAGDVNADGLADVQMLEWRPDDLAACAKDQPLNLCVPVHFDLRWALAKGDGTYDLRRRNTPWEREPGVYPTALHAADLNADGRSDFLAVAGVTREAQGKRLRTISTALSRPDNADWRLKQEEIPAQLADRDNALTFGDANGDGSTDILAAAPLPPGEGLNCTASSNTRTLLRVLPSRRDGTFVLPERWDNCSVATVVDRPWDELTEGLGLSAADVNGDGLADHLLGFLEPLETTGRVTKLVVKGDVRFRERVARPTGRDTQRWAAADVTGDGSDDLLYISPQPSATQLRTLIRVGRGRYRSRRTPAPAFANNALRSWKVLDVNGDGRADAVHLQCERIVALLGCFTTVDSFLATGDGTFKRAPPSQFYWGGSIFSDGPPSDAPAWRPMDVNADGRTDLVHLQWIPSLSLEGGALWVRTLLATPDGRWTDVPLKGPFTVAADLFDPVPGRRLQNTETWRPADVDGNGRADLVRVTGTRFSTQVVSLMATGNADWAVRPERTINAKEAGWAEVGATADQPNWRVGEINGDGKADLVHLARVGEEIRVHSLIGRGDGSWAQRWDDATLHSPVDLDVLGDLARWTVGDANADGRSDLVHVTQPGLLARVDSLLSQGDGSWAVPDPEVTLDPSSGDQAPRAWSTTNLEGDSDDDLIRVDPQTLDSGAVQLRIGTLHARAHPDALGQIEQLGGVTRVRYGARSSVGTGSGDGCLLPLGIHPLVVKRVQVLDGRSSRPDTSRYRYNCPHWSQRHRQFLGWEEVTARRAALAGQPGVARVTRYAQSDACLTLVRDSALRDPAGTFVGSRDIHGYTETGVGPPFSCLLDQRKHIEYGHGDVAQNADTSFRYDDFGNTVDVFEFGDPTTDGDERTTQRSYHPNPGPYIVGLPSGETLYGGIGPVDPVIRSAQYCYDEDTTDNCLDAPSKGLMTAVKELNLNAFADLRVTALHYDPDGNLANLINARHNGTTWIYDKAQHLFPEYECNALSRCKAIAWDAVLGRVKSVTDRNGAALSYDYDAFGRVRTTTQSNGAFVRRRYLDEGDPTRQRIREVRADGSSDGLWSVSYFDGLGRTYREVNEGARSRSPSVRLRAYVGASTALARESDWFRRGSTSRDYERYQYDRAGRAVRATHPDGSSQTWRFDAESPALRVITATDELGHAREVALDPYQRPVEVREHMDGHRQTTRLRYDAGDRLVTTTDASGNVTRRTWDRLDQLLRIDDPDLGPRQATYDPAGNLKTVTDARNRTIEFTYDPLERPETKTYPGGGQVAWHYDEPGHGASEGRLTSISDASGTGCELGRSESLSYDAAGELTASTKCVDGRSYTTGFAFDELGRTKSVTYPDREVVSYGYDRAGRMKSVSRYVKGMRYDAAGRLTSVVNANGTRARYGYERPRRWLGRASLRRGRKLIYDATYTHEANGLVRHVGSRTNAMNFTYGYDALDRLKSATGERDLSFDYTSTGGLARKSDVGTYSYPPQGPAGCLAGGQPAPCAHPHAPDRAGAYALSYDANGNLSAMSRAGSAGSRSIDWTLDHKPAVMSDLNGVVTKFGYDGWTQLVSRTTGADKTRYYGDLLEYSPKRGLVKHYFAGPQVVATRQAGKVRWYQADERGSVRVVTDERGRVAQRLDYAPYGERLSTSGAGVQFGFIGRRIDPLGGLIDMNARFLDARLGVFISADTLVPDPLMSQAYDRYAYAYGNPIAFTDPTGHGPESGPFDLSQSYSESPAPSAGWDFFVPLGGFPAREATTGWAPGQVCSACHGASAIYATPMGIRETAPLPFVQDESTLLDEFIREHRDYQRRLDELYAGAPPGEKFLRLRGEPAEQPPSAEEQALQTTLDTVALAQVTADALARGGGPPMASGGAGVLVAEGAGARGGALVGSAAVIGYGIHVLMQNANSTTPPPSPQANRAAGNAWRDKVADFFRKQGYDVRMEVSIKTMLGWRYQDIEVSKNGKVLGYVETKAGNSRYTPSQRAKDAWIRIFLGRWVDVVRQPH